MIFKQLETLGGPKDVLPSSDKVDSIVAISHGVQTSLNPGGFGFLVNGKKGIGFYSGGDGQEIETSGFRSSQSVSSLIGSDSRGLARATPIDGKQRFCTAEGGVISFREIALSGLGPIVNGTLAEATGYLGFKKVTLPDGTIKVVLLNLGKSSAPSHTS
jgi:hypothetical protein